MAEELEADVKDVLRPSEDVKITLGAALIVRGEVDTLSTNSDKNKAVLAVVTHRNRVTDEEEGRCVFSMRLGFNSKHRPARGQMLCHLVTRQCFHPSIHDLTDTCITGQTIY